MLMPDGQGNVQVAILSGLEPRDSAGLETVNFYLYTRENPKRAERRSMNDSCLPVFKYFKPKRKSKLLVHGFGDNAEDSLMFPILRDAFLARGDYNIFWVDWGQMAATPWYRTAARNTALVGRHTATLLDHLHRSTGTEMQDFHLVGFSLGSHVVGLVGKHVRTGRIKKITALDPAQVLFKTAGRDEMIDKDDADDVEVIHTSGGYLGFQTALGDRDFYPNGGSWPQPGCAIDYAAVCSHRRAYYYYEESLNKGKGFKAVPCDSWSDFSSGKCEESENALELANNMRSGKLTGTYYLSTNPSEPFAVVGKTKRRKPSTDD